MNPSGVKLCAGMIMLKIVLLKLGCGVYLAGETRQIYTTSPFFFLRW